MRAGHSRSPVLLLALLLAATTVAAEQTQTVSVVLELNQDFFYEGDPLPVRVSVRNDGDQPLSNPVKIELFKGFSVKASGGAPLKAEKARINSPSRPDRLEPQSFYGGIVDISEIFPAIRELGTYELGWAGNGLSSDKLLIKIIPKYDPAKEYSATIETSGGDIELSFFADQAPIAVKAFIDMANAGFYNGLRFDEVHPDAYIMGGNALSATPPRRAFIYPAERSVLPLMAGTVVMKPVGAAPPSNGSTFMILLRPIPTWTGQVTVLGQVVKGLDVVQRLSRVPNNGQNKRPYFKPFKDIEIRKIIITEKTENARISG